ncbi:hypothetical protein PI124_g11306 [Phytophthora idaei]|nr:hypothetical protein PI125_g10276 [Phytophthora idaei]KAG3158534.1 hypothetical protein PI126_g7788 [Phytophthora idaei]KAG3243888.1 hypothetical protein PI124_g11306 [Phytophthora idaei]
MPASTPLRSPLWSSHARASPYSLPSRAPLAPQQGITPPRPKRFPTREELPATLTQQLHDSATVPAAEPAHGDPVASDARLDGSVAPAGLHDGSVASAGLTDGSVALAGRPGCSVAPSSMMAQWLQQDGMMTQRLQRGDAMARWLLQNDSIAGWLERHQSLLQRPLQSPLCRNKLRQLSQLLH